eukprot:TRINITY_DN1639_c0_g1_i1.p1 TRINITY_DN1639_c0_g1~~TRINITY_DN1639_c0_g1_i1.p1  ORF type:complete len:1260 (+),score=432.34 TRINITY_DN1639_c0_g1_i1:384-3782(+)
MGPPLMGNQPPLSSSPVRQVQMGPPMMSPSQHSMATMGMSPQRRNEKIDGRPLQTNVETITSPDDTSKGRELSSTSISMFNYSEYDRAHPGHLIAVNDEYICYIVKADMIRLLHQKTAMRGLLKAHSPHPVTDIQFPPRKSANNILSSADKMGNIFVWLLTPTAENISVKQLAHIPGKNLPVIKLLWNPVDYTLIAAYKQNLVQIWDFNEISTKTDGELQVKEEKSIVLGQNVVDVSFSANGKEIVIAQEGTLSIWDLSTKSQVESWTPDSTNNISGVIWCKNRNSPEISEIMSSLIILGTNDNSVVRLISRETRQTIQTVNLGIPENLGKHVHFELDASGEYLFIMNSKDSTLYVVHLSLTVDTSDKIDRSQTRFNFFSQFQAQQPILSCVLNNEENQGLTRDSLGRPMGNAFKIQMYCVQTKAVQLFELTPDMCYIPHPPSITMFVNSQLENQVENNESESDASEEDTKSDEETPNDQFERNLAQIENQPVSRNPNSNPENFGTSILSLLSKSLHQQSPAALIVPEVPAVSAGPAFPEDSENVPEEISNGNAAENTEKEIPLLSPDVFNTVNPGPTVPKIAPTVPSGSPDHAAVPTPPTIIPNFPETSQNKKEDYLQVENQVEKEDEKEDQDEKEDRTKDKRKRGTRGKKNASPQPSPAQDHKAKSDAPITILSRSKKDSVETSKNTEVSKNVTPVITVSEIPVASVNRVPSPVPSPTARTEKEKKKQHREITANSHVVESISLPSTPSLSNHNGSDHLDQLLTSHMEKLYTRLEAERKEREKSEQRRQEKLLAVISQTLNANMQQQMETIIHQELETYVVPAIGKILVQTIENSLLKPLQENIKKTLVGLGPKLEVNMKESLGKVVTKNLGIEVAKSVGATLKQPMNEAFKLNFQETIVPSFERATQVMFGQMSDAMERGISESGGHGMSHPASHGSNGIDQMSLAVKSLVEVTSEMTRVIVDTQNKILSDYVERKGDAVSGSQTQAHLGRPPVAGSQKHLEALIEANQYQESFQIALNARNVNLVTWLCSRVDPHVVLSQLSPQVMLSLIQQLGVNLTTEPELKVTWLREACLAFDPADPKVQQYAPATLKQLLRNLGESIPKYSASTKPPASSFKVIMHIVNSLLKK